MRRTGAARRPRAEQAVSAECWRSTMWISRRSRAEVHALTGANGAGKSTLMNLLAGRLPAERRRDTHRRAAGSLRLAGSGTRGRRECRVPGAHGASRTDRGREHLAGPRAAHAPAAARPALAARTAPSACSTNSACRWTRRASPARSTSRPASWSRSHARCRRRRASSRSTNRPRRFRPPTQAPVRHRRQAQGSAGCWSCSSRTASTKCSRSPIASRVLRDGKHVAQRAKSPG